MDKIKRVALILSVLFVAVSSNAYFSFDSDKFLGDIDSVFSGKPEIKDLTFARGISSKGTPEKETRKFTNADKEIYVFLKLRNFKGNEVVSAKWSYDNDGKWERVGNVELTPPKDAELIYFYISRDDSFEWPVAEYKVDIYLDSQLVFTRYFDVMASKSNVSQKSSEQTSAKRIKAEPEIFNIVMAKGMDDYNDPLDISDVFLPDDKEIYLFFNTRNVNSKDKLSSKWYYMENSEWIFLAETTITPPEKTTNAHFLLKRSYGTWDPGEYKVEIFARGLFMGTKQFTIGETGSVINNTSKAGTKASVPDEESSEDDFSL